VTGVKVIVAYRRETGAHVRTFQESLVAAADAAANHIPGVRRHVRSITTPSGYRRSDPVYDAVDELWFVDEPAVRVALASQAFAGLGKRIGADPSSIVSFVVRDHLIKDGPAVRGGLKNFEFVTRRPGLSIAEFRSYWLEHHGPLAAGIETMRRYVQSHAIDSEYTGGRTPVWDGSAITWFDDMAGMRASAACDTYAATRADEVNFLGAPLALPFIITTEHVLIDGDGAG
jgi:uncharacterized protein (TIGR02118 family)